MGLTAAIITYLATGWVRVLDVRPNAVTAFDPVTYGSITVVLASVALLASWLPARRPTWAAGCSTT